MAKVLGTDPKLKVSGLDPKYRLSPKGAAKLRSMVKRKKAAKLKEAN